MIYLLDADTLIRAANDYYPMDRFAVFWEWLRDCGRRGLVKIPEEQYEEIVVGKGALVEWLKLEETKAALLLDEEADPALVRTVTTQGYASDLDEAEVEKVGRDPFLIAYGCADI